MSQDGGYILLYRRLLENPALRDVPEAMFFAWMIMLAHWKPGPKRYDERSYEVGRGELVMGERKMAEAWGWSRKKVQGLLRRLTDAGMISRNWSQHGSQRAPVISVCNYETYQFLPGSTEPRSEPTRSQGGTKVEPPKNKGNEGNKGNPLSDSPDGESSPPMNGGKASDLFGEGKRIQKAPYPEAFERFWQAWPNDHMDRKRNAGKAGTYRSWKRATKDDEPERIIRGAVNYGRNYRELRNRSSPRADEICMPTTWLNQKRWDGFADDAPKAAAKRTQPADWTYP